MRAWGAVISVAESMNTNTTDFINLPAFAKAVADHLRDSLLSRGANRRVLSLDEAAEYCGLTRDSFKKKVVRDRVRQVRFDKCWRFDIADLDQWIDSRKEEIAREASV
jgi:excisionase family DNA binding protein